MPWTRTAQARGLGIDPSFFDACALDCCSHAYWRPHLRPHPLSSFLRSLPSCPPLMPSPHALSSPSSNHQARSASMSFTNSSAAGDTHSTLARSQHSMWLWHPPMASGWTRLLGALMCYGDARSLDHHIRYSTITDLTTPPITHQLPTSSFIALILPCPLHILPIPSHPLPVPSFIALSSLPPPTFAGL